MSRTLVVGWDGGTWSVADPLIEAGRLPVLASLSRSAAKGTLESVPNMNSAPAWSTIVTGVDPGRHGIFYFDERVPGSYGRRIINAERRAAPSLWRMSSDAGRRIVVVNVPISYPAEPVNGVLVAGLDTPSKDLPGFAHPSDLPRRYADLFRSYVVEPQAPTLIRDGRVREAERALLDAVDGWTSLTARLMQDEDWDLVFVVFTSTDTCQHFFWDVEGNRVVERVYEVQDEATGRLVELARSQDPDVNVIVLADHGGATNTRGPELMPVWLEDQGLMTRVQPGLRSRLMVRGFNLINRKLTRERKRALARVFPGLKERAEAESRLGGIDWSRTRAYSDGVRDDVLINLEGRDPQGVVGPEELDGFVAELKSMIAGITEEDTGRPVVDEALHRNDVYQGPFVDRAPDFTIRWRIENRAFAPFAARTETGRARMREILSRSPQQPGGHHPLGMFVATGPNVRPGPVAGRLADVTPTVLALLGVPVPDDLDGRPLGFLERVEVVSAERGSTEMLDRESGYSPEEEEAVRRRLEDLGYI
ncbi:MAG: alkaline phosphatase family protein [Actinomycetota bacterium]